MQVKKRIFAGAVCEQVIYESIDGTRGISKKNPRPRFKNDEEREAHRLMISKRHHAMLINANFSTTSIYSTLTFNPEYECHDFTDARILRDRFWRKLRRSYPDAKMVMYMGKGKGTHRIHLHMISDGIPAEELKKAWIYGDVCAFSNLREHNIDKRTGKDLGRDYTGLADYCFDHWTPEQGKGKRYKRTANLIQPEEEEPTACIIQYSAQRPPRPPKGYMFTGDCTVTQYGFMRFHYVLIPPPITRRKKE